jgi:hypothetical protein
MYRTSLPPETAIGHILCHNLAGPDGRRTLAKGHRLQATDLPCFHALGEQVDLLDGTPERDIKPYVPLFDDRPAERIGWFAAQAQRVYDVRADDRFAT